MRAVVKTKDKRWGKEIWFANNEEKDYCGKILEIDPANELSLHFPYDKRRTPLQYEGRLPNYILNTNGFRNQA